MPEREKEFEELKEIIFGIILKAPIREIPLEKIAKTIQEKGYTKKHFPVEKLKSKLREQRAFDQNIIFKKENGKSEVNYEGELDFYKGRVEGYLFAIMEIKELEDET